MTTTKPLLTQQEEIDLLRDALDHIARAAASSRTNTRRLSFIEERARGALKYRPYNARDFELPGVRSAETIQRDRDYAKRYRKLRHRDLLTGVDFAIEDLTGLFGDDMDAFVDQLPPLPQEQKKVRDDDGVLHEVVKP